MSDNLKIIEKEEGVFLEVTYESPVQREGTIKWVFKELSMKDFMAIDISEKLIEGKTKIGQVTAPMMYMLNIMMVEGPKINDETPNRWYGFLKQEMADFLL